MDSDLAPLKVVQADLSYYATFDPPPFELIGQWVELQSSIYARLRRFKLRLRDIKIESTSSNPGDISIACWLFDYGAVARYRLDRVEVWSNRPQLGENAGLATEIVQEAMAVVRDVCPKAQVSLRSTDFALHGSFAGEVDVATRIATYITELPGGLPSLRANGVSFLCEFPTGQGQGSIILERSAVVTNGALVRVISEHVGSLPEIEALNRAIEFFETSIARLGLRVVWRE